MLTEFAATTSANRLVGSPPWRLTTVSCGKTLAGVRYSRHDFELAP